MTAEKLREAARMIRERAELADSQMPGPWEPRVLSDARAWVAGPNDALAMHGYPFVAQHIASWHPAVALAVADWLEEAADAFDNHMAKQMDPLRRFHVLWLAEAERKHERALAVARAYLGEQS